MLVNLVIMISNHTKCTVTTIKAAGLTKVVRANDAIKKVTTKQKAYLFMEKVLPRRETRLSSIICFRAEPKQTFAAVDPQLTKVGKRM